MIQLYLFLKYYMCGMMSEISHPFLLKVFPDLFRESVVISGYLVVSCSCNTMSLSNNWKEKLKQIPVP